MTTLADLLESAPVARSGQGAHLGRYVIDAGDDTDARLAALVTLFVEDEELQGVRLVRTRQADRVLERDAVLDLVQSLEKDAGAGDGFFLPGSAATTWRVSCAVKGCNQAWFAGSRSVATSSRCPDHPTADVEVAAREPGR